MNNKPVINIKYLYDKLSSSKAGRLFNIYSCLKSKKVAMVTKIVATWSTVYWTFFQRLENEMFN